MRTGYTCYGSIRGCCEHRHKTIAAAHKCIDTDNRRCFPSGYSDRKVVDVNEDGILLHGEREGMLVRLGREKSKHA